jgi:hypothetical protein
MELDVWIRPRNKAPVYTMQIYNTTASERGESSSLCCVEPFDYFLPELMELFTGGLSERNTLLGQDFR